MKNILKHSFKHYYVIFQKIKEGKYDKVDLR